MNLSDIIVENSSEYHCLFARSRVLFRCGTMRIDVFTRHSLMKEEWRMLGPREAEIWCIIQRKRPGWAGDLHSFHVPSLTFSASPVKSSCPFPFPHFEQSQVKPRLSTLYLFPLPLPKSPSSHPQSHKASVEPPLNPQNQLLVGQLLLLVVNHRKLVCLQLVFL